jgi:hypothetical protein
LISHVLEKIIKHLSLLCIFFLVISLIQFDYNTIYPAINQNNDNLKRQIEICCTWGQKLADGILTYEINNAKPELTKLVISALNYWGEKIQKIEFKEVVGSKEQADIKISFRNDNGKAAGQTITNFDSEGFIFNAKIYLLKKLLENN